VATGVLGSVPAQHPGDVRPRVRTPV